MSCEQLRDDIDKKRDAFAFGSNQRLTLVACKVVLDDCCPSQRSRLTHTEKILNSEQDALANRNWQDAKRKVEAMLEGIKPSVSDNFNTMVKKIQESNNAEDENSREKSMGEAREVGTSIIRTFADSLKADRDSLRDYVDRRTLIFIDMVPDIYDVLMSSEGAEKAIVHELLSLDPDAPRPTNSRGGIY